MKKLETCETCDHAVITLLAECSKMINGKHVHKGGLCPDEFTCKYYEEADRLTISMNSIDWENSVRVDVD